MSASNAYLSGIAGVQGVASFASAYAQSQAMRTQGWYQSRMYDLNARMANFQAEDAIKRGDKDAKRHGRNVRGLIGRQRAALAAQGIDIEDGSALDIQEDTAAAGAEDMLAIRNNAWREAWGFKVQAVGMQGAGAFASMSSKFAARNTLMTGGMQAAGYGMESGYHLSKTPWAQKRGGG